MASKKPDRRVQTTNGATATAPAANGSKPPIRAQEGKTLVEPVADPAPKAPRPPRMTKAQLEQHVHSLEAQVARLTAELEEIRGPQIPWWEKISGSFANDPDFKEAMRLGREWRESFRPKKRTRKAESSDGRS